MIDIYTFGPYLTIKELFYESVKEVSWYLLTFFFFLMITLILKRFSSNYIQLIGLILMVFLQLSYIYMVSIKSEFLFSLSLALLVTMQVWLLQLFSLHALDYAFMFCVMLFPTRLFNSTSSLIGTLWLFGLIYLILYTTTKLGIQKLKGNYFSCYFLFVWLSLSAYILHLVCIFIPESLQHLLGSYSVSFSFILCITMITLIAITFFIKHKFYKQLLRLNQLGKKYASIELYFPCISMLILLVCISIFIPFTIMQLHNILIILLISCLCLVLLWMQLPFIFLLLQSSFYKDIATFKQLENEELSHYYKELSSSLNSMQEMRHDIKNIFFTMGNFVDQSPNQEMKDFFWQKIYPYSLKTIYQSELLSKLYQIPVESLRAFFNLKISQALNHKIKVQLDIYMIPETFQLGMDIIDLTRILGILFDNAIEETLKISEGTIYLKISNADTHCSYTIKNPITKQTQQTGIHMGQSSKGTGRGKGLKIVHQLLKQYPTSTLNTSIYQQTCIQCLTIS